MTTLVPIPPTQAQPHGTTPHSIPRARRVARQRCGAILVLDIAENGQIQAVRTIVNPDKLCHLDQATS